MSWIHIDFFFDGSGLTQDEKFAFENLVRKIIKRTRWIVRRKFYLYEPQPNCFLALEIRSVIFIPVILWLCVLYRNKHWFIKHMGVHTSGGRYDRDNDNGEGFLSIMNAFTEWYLFTRFDNKTGLSHILHCILEFQTMSRYKEVYWYKYMLKEYDPDYQKDDFYGTKRSDTDKKKHKSF